MLKRILRQAMRTVVRWLCTIPYGRAVAEEFMNSSRELRQSVTHGGVTLNLAVPNQVCRYRAETFSSKEPDTLKWIDSMDEKSVLWDIGANVGLYSLYAAKRKACRSFAFEPSVFNLELLARNIDYNDLQGAVTIVALPLSAGLGVNEFKLSNTICGGAHSTFGEGVDQDGNPLVGQLSFATLGIAADDARKLLGIPQPDYIKIDVDGIEHLILSGAQEVLQGVRSLLVEVNDDFEEQRRRCAEVMANAGFVLSGKTGTGVGNQFNQVWTKAA